MTLITCGPILWPNVLDLQGTTGLGSVTTIDAAGEYHAWVGPAQQDMTISHWGFQVATATGSPTVDLRIETVDLSTGLPSGTLWAANTNKVSGTITASTWQLEALTASASITKGQFFAAKMVYNSGTSIVLRQGLTRAAATAVPYRVINTGSPTISGNSNTMTWALGSSTTSFYYLQGMIPALTVTNGAFNNTNSAKRGLRFQVPFKCRCVGMWTYLNGVDADMNIAIADDAGSELSSSSTAIDDLTTSSANAQNSYFFFDNAVTLSPATWYRVYQEPTSATNTGVSFITMPSSSYIGATPFGSNAHYTTFASGSWTDTATDSIPWMGIIIDQLDDGVSAGGGSMARVQLGH